MNIISVIDEKTFAYMRYESLSNFNYFKPYRKIKGVYPNDYIFFKLRSHNRIYNKSVVAFGRIAKIKKLKADSMWKYYNKENGFNSYQSFLNATNKDDNYLSLYIKDLKILSLPIYLSDFDYKLPRHLDLYYRLDHQEFISAKLFKEIKKVGLDSFTQNDHNLDLAELIIHLRYLITKLKRINYLPHDLIKLKKEIKKLSDYYHLNDYLILKKINDHYHLIVYNPRSFYDNEIIGLLTILRYRFAKYSKLDFKIEIRS